MDERILRLLTLIDEEARNAYWSKNAFCWADMAPHCERCDHFTQCQRQKLITQLLSQLKEEAKL